MSRAGADDRGPARHPLGTGVPGGGDGPGSGSGVDLEIASELTGALPCVRCRYDLRGLSILGECPECGTPVQATILAVVDPQAEELQPLGVPRLVAIGVTLWAGGAAAGTALSWAPRLADVWEMLVGGRWDTAWVPPAGMTCLIMSGLGALAILRPHSGIPAGKVLAALAGWLAYLPLGWLYWRLHAQFDPGHGVPYLVSTPPDPERLALRLGISACLLVAVLGLRHNLWLLSARSVLIRTGRADRQGMNALAAAVLVACIGDALLWLSSALPGLARDVAATGAVFLIAVGSMLFTLGCGGLALDALRLYPALAWGPVSLRSILKRPDRAGPGRSNDGPRGSSA